MNDPRTSDALAVGDIAVVVSAAFHPENIGCEVEIVGPLQMRCSRQTGKYLLAYRIRRGDGKEFAAHPQHLRKKRPPRDDLKVVRWDECPWQPESINV